MKTLFFLICVLFVYTQAETTINFNFDGMIPPLPSCNCNATTYCGDGVCNGGETNVTCPNDCNVHVPVCGDLSCDPNETAFSCPTDCSRCGDKLCDNTESLTSCPTDCVACGDGFCTLGFETSTSCPVDCSNVCGDRICDGGETHTTCPDDCPCIPQCSGRNCGSDGCSGTCGSCNNGQTCNTNGVCVSVCTPNCSGRNCGSDGCSGTCGSCTNGQTCNANGVCVSVCTPSCSGRNCGSDGCSGTCGSCSAGQTCNANGVCVCAPNCVGRNCGSDGCGGSCGTCSNGQTCNTNGVCTCSPSCSGRNCGSDGCGGSCGTCPSGQSCDSNGNCQSVCQANCFGRNCGSDGCGGSCGSCASGQTCNTNGVCVCSPNCVGRNCGGDGCGGSCGTCSNGQTCNTNGVCVCSPNCVGRNCGGDGCGGSCGSCSGSQVCNANGVCEGVCTPNCAGRNCGSNGCGGSCGTCPSGQVCTSGVCQLPTGVRTVDFTLYQVNAGFAAYASGVTVTSSVDSDVTTSLGMARLDVAINDTVTFSGVGYQSVEVIITGDSKTISFFVPPVLTANEVLIALLWDDYTADLDLHMFGPGDLVYYSSPEGVVNWEYTDKNLSWPYAQWKDYSSSTVGLELTTIYQLNYSAIYEFVGYLWSRVDGGDPTYNWNNVSASMLVFGGSATGLSGLYFHADAPNPPAGFDWGFWSPFSFRPDGTGNLNVIEDTTPFDPPISIESIDKGDQQQISCSYAYCPYRLP